MELAVQINEKFVEANTALVAGKLHLLVTPPLDGDYWLMRVPVSKKQAIVCFPKFGTIGIGFQHEQDWNTNLPYQCETLEIFNHIAHNKGTGNIPDARCIEAIRLLQEAIAQMKMAPAN